MRANPGGQLAPADIVGRDQLIEHLWRILERQSLVLSAERRMGKTSIIRKMQAEAPADLLMVYRDLEDVKSPLEFAELVFSDVEEHLRLTKRTAASVRQFLKQISGAEIGDVIKFPEIAAPHWKTLLTRTIEDLMKHQKRRLIFLWDEMPLMIENIRKGQNETAAMEILDTLRSLRQTHSALRMVFTGSIGLHHVISDLKSAGYTNAPTNDMYLEDVPPLSPDDATSLALRLLRGERVTTKDSSQIARQIATATDGVAFYIHHIVDRLSACRETVDAVRVEAEVLSGLTDPQDRWDLGHYRSRIDAYYASDETRYTLALLDILAKPESALTFDDLFNQVNSQIKTDEAETIRKVLKLLQRDHYVIQQTDGKYRFRFSLIQRWWRLNRGLPE